MLWWLMWWWWGYGDGDDSGGGYNSGDGYECGDGCDNGEYVLNPESLPKAKFWNKFISTANTKTYTKYDCLK